MARTNVAPPRPKARTHAGGPAKANPNAPEQLIRQVASCMLFEDTFYEKGSDIAKGIEKSCAQVSPADIATVAIMAREAFKLRHVPLFLLAQLNKRRSEVPGLLADTVARVVQRADELAESLAILAKVEGVKPDKIKTVLSHGFAKGLARAFQKFDEYRLAKYNRDGAIKLRDVLFLTHAKPIDKAQAKLWKKLVEGKLETPDTWEVELSAGKDKKATFERLIAAGKLGYMALLRNLRNMEEADVSRAMVRKALLDGVEGSKALPFRFITAARHAPAYAGILSDAMLVAMKGQERLAGETAVVVDVSGSMEDKIAGKAEISRLDAAAGVAVLLREVCEDARVFSFSNSLVEINPVRGLPLIESIARSQPHGGTNMHAAVQRVGSMGFDRIIVLTDEQSGDGPLPVLHGAKGYVINVAPYKPGLATNGGWTRINGFSERVVDWIQYEEKIFGEDAA